MKICGIHLKQAKMEINTAKMLALKIGNFQFYNLSFHFEKLNKKCKLNPKQNIYFKK